MVLPVAGAAVSIVKPRGLDAAPRLPAASATRAVKECVKLLASFVEGVNDHVLPSTVALPRKSSPE